MAVGVFWLHLKLSMSGTENVIFYLTQLVLGLRQWQNYSYYTYRVGTAKMPKSKHATSLLCPFLCRLQTEATGMKVIKGVCRILMK